MAKLSTLRKAVEITEKFQDIPLEKIIEKDNVRSEYNGIEELADSIVMSGGLLQPIVVLKIDADKYQLIAGHRRLRAYQKLKNEEKVSYNTIPAIVKLNIESIPENQLIENIQRENLSDRDIEKAVVLILEKEKLKNKDLALKLGKSESWISKIISAKKGREEIEKVSTSKVLDLSTNDIIELKGLPDDSKEKLLNQGNKKPTVNEIRKEKEKVSTSKVLDKKDKPANTGEVITRIKDYINKEFSKLNKEEKRTVQSEIDTFMRKIKI